MSVCATGHVYVRAGRRYGAETYDLGLQFKDAAQSLYMPGYAKPVFSEASATAWKSGDSITRVALPGTW